VATAAAPVLAYGGWYASNVAALHVDEVGYARTALGQPTGSPYTTPPHAVAPMVGVRRRGTNVARSNGSGTERSRPS
jgi:hypothetical protein